MLETALVGATKTQCTMQKLYILRPPRTNRTLGRSVLSWDALSAPLSLIPVLNPPLRPPSKIGGVIFLDKTGATLKHDVFFNQMNTVGGG